MEIRNLIEKFFDGQTSIEEERELRRILNEEKLPKDLIHEKELILSLLPSPAVAPVTLIDKIEKIIEDAEAREKTAPHQPSPKRSQKRSAGYYTL